MDKRESIIRLIRTLPEDKVNPVFDLVAKDLIQSQFGEGATKKVSIDTLDNDGNILLEHKVRKDATLSVGEAIKLRYEKQTLNIRITADTIMPKKYIIKGERIKIMGKISRDGFTADAIVSKEFYDMFDAFKLKPQKLYAMNRFIKLPEAIRNGIVAQLSGKRYPTVKGVSDQPTDISILRFKFDMCRDSYTPQQQMDIDAIFEESKSLTTSNQTRAARRLAYILNINQSSSTDIFMTKEKIIEELDKHLYKHDKLKEKLAQAVIASKYTNKKGFAILLVGSPGVGKTAIMKALAAVLGIPFFVIPLGSYTSMVDVLGDAPHYDASDCGEVIKAYYKAGTTRVVLGLDEYDKSYESAKEGGKVSKAFNDALSDEHYFKDAFLGTYINTANTIFIATANSTDTIPDNLINRFTVIHVDDYTEDDKVQIAQNFILPSVLESFGVANDEIVVDSNIIKYITQNFCEDDGARDLKKNIESIVEKVLSSWDSSGTRSRVSVDKALVDLSLGSHTNENSPNIIFRRNKNLYSPEISEEITDMTVKL
ncbi:MAG: AAA family ATPase, partial [Acutalibacteraceae bacterium]